MSFETFVGIMCLIGAGVCWGLYRYLDTNVYYKSKYQRGRYITAPRGKKGAKK